MESNNQADSIVSKQTAFGSYAELREAMSAGYVPTASLRRQGELVRLLRDRGLPVFVVS